MRKLKTMLGAKLKSQSGESLGEVLVALLIAALAMTMLASVITTTSRIIKQSKDDLKTYYDANDALAAQEIVTTGSNVTPVKNVVITMGEGPSQVTIKLLPSATQAYVFENAAISGKKVVAYQYKIPTGGGGS
jgi:Tfp pilus assembly protein PilV